MIPGVRAIGVLKTYCLQRAAITKVMTGLAKSRDVIPQLTLAGPFGKHSEQNLVLAED